MATLVRKWPMADCYFKLCLYSLDVVFSVTVVHTMCSLQVCVTSMALEQACSCLEVTIVQGISVNATLPGCSTEPLQTLTTVAVRGLIVHPPNVSCCKGKNCI